MLRVRGWFALCLHALHTCAAWRSLRCRLLPAYTHARCCYRAALTFPRLRFCCCARARICCTHRARARAATALRRARAWFARFAARARAARLRAAHFLRTFARVLRTPPLLPFSAAHRYHRRHLRSTTFSYACLHAAPRAHGMLLLLRFARAAACCLVLLPCRLVRARALLFRALPWFGSRSPAFTSSLLRFPAAGYYTLARSAAFPDHWLLPFTFLVLRSAIVLCLLVRSLSRTRAYLSAAATTAPRFNSLTLPAALWFICY